MSSGTYESVSSSRLCAAEDSQADAGQRQRGGDRIGDGDRDRNRVGERRGHLRCGHRAETGAAAGQGEASAGAQPAVGSQVGVPGPSHSGDEGVHGTSHVGTQSRGLVGSGGYGRCCGWWRRPVQQGPHVTLRFASPADDVNEDSICVHRDCLTRIDPDRCGSMCAGARRCQRRQSRLSETWSG